MGKFDCKAFTIAYYVLQIGMIIFLLALAGMTASMAIDGLGMGEYKLRFSKTGGGYTMIKWTTRPIRFAFQTVVFIGFLLCSSIFQLNRFDLFQRKDDFLSVLE
ncbi:hypothetical protein KUH03_00540 [Sphingobacterium sp. E70]|uniref:hypothetical protein n=1 Tax=Sphingobacterium sp. E70 TaxID=2853439 RepID=UPI00211C1270|nr:hypothetical protein [Sphingobacterium sp. E70]ULT25539.1 hypothetical protein KUH03_00540 [Sphingobacterium sp. E70]